ncbi:isoprenylcysteine carboxylmethyltransferase family protein [Robiginitalea sp. SC105]|uniref:methyltransferase family protein n=1 Tax=Robiginitalea sp. SC105 TaxID=2762332 RepID=UPI00163A3119|nr:isoprenylcysteine carboxylmethyltransferase family protein [Robiginitalea sp. SC105]MBC2839476.1 isoprenylcysteine carboxylmethyltransferase family protein [Robiginitalea sp. SC105]
MKALELRIPPALVFLSFGGAMYLLALWLPVGHFDFFGRRWLIYALSGAGLVVMTVALIQFAIKRTTVDPMAPRNAGQLVTSGIYNYTRNPMYLAMLMFLLAWGLHLENAFNTLLAAGFVGYMNRYQILPEEQALLERFGAAYRQYSKLVRRWF